MRVRKVGLLVAPEDLTAVLAEFPLPQRVTDLRLTTGDGMLNLQLGYRVGPVTAPVHLVLRVAGLRPEELELATELRAGLELPGLLAGGILSYLVRSADLPELTVRGQHLVLNLAGLAERLGVGFQLTDLRFTPDGVQVELADLTLASPEPMAAEEPEVEILPPLPSPISAPPPEYGDFYERIRERVRRWAEGRVPPRYRRLVPWLLLLPDLFALMVRLSRDPRVPIGFKVLLVGSITYALSPVDVIPDFIPVAGVSDDLALILLALAELLSETPVAVLQEHWSGEGNVAEVIRDGARMVRSFFDNALLERLREWLRRWTRAGAEEPKG